MIEDGGPGWESGDLELASSFHIAQWCFLAARGEVAGVVQWWRRAGKRSPRNGAESHGAKDARDGEKRRDKPYRPRIELVARCEEPHARKVYETEVESEQEQDATEDDVSDVVSRSWKVSQ